MEICSLCLNKIEIPSCTYASTIILEHHLDFNKTSREKVKWKLHSDPACCFEQILEVATYKKTAAWSLTSHLPNHLCKMSKTCWALLEK